MGCHMDVNNRVICNCGIYSISTAANCYNSYNMCFCLVLFKYSIITL